jgi:hypothetical protein
MAQHSGNDGQRDDSATALSFRTSADTSGEVSRVLGKLEASGNDLPINQLLANATGSFRPFVLLSDALIRKAALPPFIRETVVLHLAARLGVRYEWGEHIPMSEDAGVTEQMRAALSAPASGDLSVLTEDQRAAVRLADEILARTLSDADWREACSRWGREAALDLAIAVGFWGGMVPTVIGVIERHGLVPLGRRAPEAKHRA